MQGCNHLRGRRAGSSLHLDVNIEVACLICFLLCAVCRTDFVLIQSFLYTCKVVSDAHNILSNPYSSLQVDPFSSVSAAHDVGENVRDRIQKLHPEVAEVFIHIGSILAFVIFYTCNWSVYLSLSLRSILNLASPEFAA